MLSDLFRICNDILSTKTTDFLYDLIHIFEVNTEGLPNRLTTNFPLQNERNNFSRVTKFWADILPKKAVDFPYDLIQIVEPKPPAVDCKQSLAG